MNSVFATFFSTASAASSLEVDAWASAENLDSEEIPSNWEGSQKNSPSSAQCIVA
jgi:hypothetical protein